MDKPKSSMNPIRDETYVAAVKYLAGNLLAMASGCAMHPSCPVQDHRLDLISDALASALSSALFDRFQSQATVAERLRSMAAAVEKAEMTFAGQEPTLTPAPKEEA